MAKTFYKYVAQDQEARVDWNQVARDFTDSIKEESNDRQRRKDELKKAHDETLKYLQQPPQGDNQTLNASIQGFANSAMKQSTLMYDMLTSGQLKPRDYKISMQNLADDSQGLYDVWTQYSEDYDKMLGRQNIKDGEQYAEGAEIEQYMWQNMEFFSNFKNYKPTIDPNSGRVYYAKVDKDGNVSTNPNDRASIIDLRSRLRTKYDNVDVDTLTTNITDQIGKWVFENRDGRNGIEVLDMMRGAEGSERRKLYEDYKSNSVNSLMVSNLSNATILTNHIGTVDIDGNPVSYGFTWDPNEAKRNANLILLKKNPDGSGQPDPQLTDTQKKAVKKYLSTRIDIKIDEIRKYREHYDAKYPPGYAAMQDYKRKMSPDVYTFNQLVKLGQGTYEQQKAAIKHLRQRGKFADLKFTTEMDNAGNKRIDKLFYRNADNKNMEIDVSGMTTENFVDANVLNFIPEGNINYLKTNSRLYMNMRNRDLEGDIQTKTSFPGKGTLSAKLNIPRKTDGLSKSEIEKVILKVKQSQPKNNQEIKEKAAILENLSQQLAKKPGSGMEYANAL